MCDVSLPRNVPSQTHVLPTEGEERALEALDERPDVVQRERLPLLVQLRVVEDDQEVAKQAAHHGHGGVQPLGAHATYRGAQAQAGRR